MSGTIDELVRANRNETLFRKLSNHITAHPIRMLVTIFIPLVFSIILTLYALNTTIQSNEQRNAEICRQVNELRETLYITALDFGRTSSLSLRQQQALAQRFLPLESCEEQ